MTTLTADTTVTPGIPPEEAWQMVLVQMKAQMARVLFETHFGGTTVLDLSEDTLTIAAPTAYARDWLASRMTSTIRRQIAPLIGRPVEVRFVFVDSAVGQGEAACPAEPILEKANVHPSEKTAGPDVITARAADVLPGAESGSGPVGEGDPCPAIVLEAIAGTVEAAIGQRGRIIAFPRYELRHIPLVGPQNFFLRLAFLQERYFNTPEDGRAKPFETSVDELLRWANVGRATLHRFKKGDSARGQQPAAAWFGIEQLPSAPRSGTLQQQPPCRYRIQQGIPLTPMDSDRLYALLIRAGIRTGPLQALQTVCQQPVQEILQFPPPAPTEAQKRRAPQFTTVSSLVQSALNGVRIEPDMRPQIQEWVTRLADHVTMPQQMVFVSWYFLRQWLPRLGHDAAALVLYARAQGYYNPQDQELREEFAVAGGYSELARVIGLKRDRTIGDWLPNIFDRQPRGGESTPGEAGKWQREQHRQQQIQSMVGQFIQVVPGSRKKMPGRRYAFHLHVEIKGEPLTPTDCVLRDWVHQTLAACEEAGVLETFHAWVTSPVTVERGQRCDQNQEDGWGTLQVRSAAAKMTGGESGCWDDDGWGILEGILDDGLGILARSKMTAGELFKGLLRLNTFWDSILIKIKSTTTEAPETKSVVVKPSFDLRSICQHNGGLNPFREQVISGETSTTPFLSWILYAYSYKGKGIDDPVGFALSRLKAQSNAPADGIFARLAALPFETLARLLHHHLDSASAPADPDWRLAFRDTPCTRLKEMAEMLGV